MRETFSIWREETQSWLVHIGPTGSYWSPEYRKGHAFDSREEAQDFAARHALGPCTIVGSSEGPDWQAKRSAPPVEIELPPRPESPNDFPNWWSEVGRLIAYEMDTRGASPLAVVIESRTITREFAVVRTSRGTTA